MKEIGKSAQAVVLMMMNTLAGVFGHMNRQRAIGAEQTEAENRYLMHRAICPFLRAGQRRGGKPH